MSEVTRTISKLQKENFGSSYIPINQEAVEASGTQQTGGEHDPVEEIGAERKLRQEFAKVARRSSEKGARWRGSGVAREIWARAARRVSAKFELFELFARVAHACTCTVAGGAHSRRLCGGYGWEGKQGF